MCFVPMALAVVLVTHVSYWFYPVSSLLIANRLLALSLLGHEGVHGTLFIQKGSNDFIARWICCYPTFMSLTEYRKKHFMHHGGLGSRNWDPDRHLYDFYPLNWLHFVGRLFLELATLRLTVSFYRYYVKPPTNVLQRALQMNAKSERDFVGFWIFHLVLIGAAIAFHFWAEYLIFYSIPLFCLMQPYIILMGGLQHGALFERPSEYKSRSIVGKKALIEVLLPCDIGFHAEHHLDPGVPHYQLSRFAQDLTAQNSGLHRTTYVQALVELFAKAESRRS